MAEPCHSACPAGDCAGCAFPPHLARCNPRSTCPQAAQCQRSQPALCDPAQPVVDGTVLHHTEGVWCPMFVDMRGAALEAA